MKRYFQWISIFLLVTLNVYAQSEGKIAYSFAATDGCKMMIGDFGWKEGQILNLKEMQEAVKRLGVPKGWILKPEKTVQELLALDPNVIPTVVYHCITPTHPAKIATFYLEYINKANEKIRTPAITLWYAPDDKTSKVLPEY